MDYFDVSFNVKDKTYTAKFKLEPLPFNNKIIVFDIYPSDYDKTWNMTFTTTDLTKKIDYNYAGMPPAAKEKEFKMAVAKAILKKCMLQDIKVFKDM